MVVSTSSTSCSSSWSSSSLVSGLSLFSFRVFLRVLSEESIQARSKKTKPTKEGGGGVITLTGSVEVAAPQSNIVIQVQDDSDASLSDDSDAKQDDVSKPTIPGAGLESPGDSLKVPDAKLNANSSEANKKPASESSPAHPISHPEGGSHAFARIGL